MGEDKIWLTFIHGISSSIKVAFLKYSVGRYHLRRIIPSERFPSFTWRLRADALNSREGKQSYFWLDIVNVAGLLRKSQPRYFMKHQEARIDPLYPSATLLLFNPRYWELSSPRIKFAFLRSFRKSFLTFDLIIVSILDHRWNFVTSDREIERERERSNLLSLWTNLSKCKDYKERIIN